MKRLSLLMVSLAAASMALATTYVRVEKDGSKTYSDRPLPGGKPVELEPVQTYSAPQNTHAPSSSDLPAEQRALEGIDDFTYSSCSLSPANDETIPNPETVSVSVSLEPALRAGDTVNLVVDGKAADPYQTTLILQPVERGAHTASVALKDNHGRTLCSSSVTFNVMQPALARPRRR
ncbi:MAG TPA: hypothetical protein VM146_14980 [Steroidobacteraceae bacterium]|nr:hypothetical protein [Steroidobacteraceae bacterium]